MHIHFGCVRESVWEGGKKHAHTKKTRTALGLARHMNFKLKVPRCHLNLITTYLTIFHLPIRDKIKFSCLWDKSHPLMEGHEMYTFIGRLSKLLHKLSCCCCYCLIWIYGPFKNISHMLSQSLSQGGQ